MKLRTWPICLTVLFLLIFYVASFAQDKQINVAANINKNVVPLTLDDKVNTNYVEAGPLISASGKRLYYSRFGHPSNTGGKEDTDIWYNQYNDSTQSWSEAINIGAPLNNKGPNFVCEVGWTDDTLMVANRYYKKGKMKAGVSISSWNGKSWNMPAPIEVKNDYNLAENVGYDLSSYRNVLLITEEKVDFYGKTDLYVSFRDHSKSRTTTESFNLGPVINSTGSERSPFLTDDTKTIYFASDGHKGYGKLDIFRSNRLDDTWTNWSVPENLGPGINTPFDDRNFSFGSTSRFAYYSRGITADRSDIHCVQMSELFIPSMSSVKELTGKSTATEAGQTITVKNVFLEGRSELSDSAKIELSQIVAYMKRVNNLVVLVSTHSNVHKKRSESLALSDQRLKEVKQYLTSNGIDQNRVRGESNGHDVMRIDARDYLGHSVEIKFINRVIISTAPKSPN